MNAHHLFEGYATAIDGQPCYFAGLPGYPRNFSRDTIIAGIIAADHHLLDSQLAMSYLHQGKRYDHITGEEPGKIHHEYPGVIWHAPYVSTYNACDTTALYLVGLEFLKHLNKRESNEFLDTHQVSIESALEYIYHHIKDDIFWEFPPEGAKHYSLDTTYWKDSIVPSLEGKEEPAYPVSYALVQFQVARGLLAAANLLEREDLREKSDAMYKKGIGTFITKEAFCVEQDEVSRLEQPSSDELHALAYIPMEYKKMLPIKEVGERALQLVTAAGIVCTPKEIGMHIRDQLHGYVVWIFEQAIIHYGCTKFGLDDLARATLGSTGYIDTGHEYLSVEPTIGPIGNSHQLWSVAAKIYFSDMPSLRQTNWL